MVKINVFLKANYLTICVNYTRNKSFDGQFPGFYKKRTSSFGYRFLYETREFHAKGSTLLNNSNKHNCRLYLFCINNDLSLFMDTKLKVKLEIYLENFQGLLNSSTAQFIFRCKISCSLWRQLPATILPYAVHLTQPR